MTQPGVVFHVVIKHQQPAIGSGELGRQVVIDEHVVADHARRTYLVLNRQFLAVLRHGMSSVDRSHRTRFQMFHVVGGAGVRVFQFVDDLAGFDVAVKGHFAPGHGERTITIVGVFDDEHTSRRVQWRDLLADDAVSGRFRATP